MRPPITPRPMKPRVAGTVIADDAFPGRKATPMLRRCPRPSLTERRRTAGQVAPLFLRGVPAKDAISVREPAESFDNVVVQPRVARVFREVVEPGTVSLGRQRLELLDGSALEVEVLGMLERHVQEDALDLMQGSVLSGLDRGDAVGSRLRVVCECSRRTAMDVSRHLIEQYHERQPSGWRTGPIVEDAPRRVLQQRTEPRRTLVVEPRVGAEPDIAATPATPRDFAPHPGTRNSVRPSGPPRSSVDAPRLGHTLSSAEAERCEEPLTWTRWSFRAMAKWPNVPAVSGWLSLESQGGVEAPGRIDSESRRGRFHLPQLFLRPSGPVVLPERTTAGIRRPRLHPLGVRARRTGSADHPDRPPVRRRRKRVARRGGHHDPGR